MDSTQPNHNPTGQAVSAYNNGRASRAKAWTVKVRAVLRRSLCGALAVGAVTGCAQRVSEPDPHAVEPTPTVVVVAPVINLSDDATLDSLKVTDWVASEALTIPGLAVVPVNMTLAALAQQGRHRVETPDDARALADEFDADATLVIALTEYDPYDPPRVGIVAQWYAVRPQRVARMNPVATSRLAADSVGALPDSSATPTYQVQRSFDGADERLLAELRDYVAASGGDQSPYGWRKYVKSQELFTRYCIRSAILPMVNMRQSHADTERQGG